MNSLLDSLEEKVKRIESLSNRIKELESALKVIYTTTRGDQHGTCWTIRGWLNEHGVYNDDIGSAKRLVEEVCKTVLKVK